VKILTDLFGRFTEQSEAALREQYGSLKRQIPLMYLLMAIDVAFLAIVTRKEVSFAMSVGVPIALSIVLAARSVAWIARTTRAATLDQMRLRLSGTVAVAGVLSALFGAWGLALFEGADPGRGTSIALFVFVGSIGCCYCLQVLPVAARLVLLFGAMPVTVRLLMSQDWYLIGIGVTFLLVAAVILRTLRASRAAFSEILRSRSEMAALLSALQRSEEHHRYSVELNPQIPWIGSPDGSVIELSPRWEALTGISHESALRDGWTQSVHPDDLPGVLELWEAARTSEGQPVADSRYRLRQADGSYRWFRARARPRRDADGRIFLWYGNLEDIHDQVSAEMALRESEERYRLASRATNDVIWDWSHDSNAIHWTDGIESVFGYPVEPSGTPLDWWMAQIHPEDLPGVMELYHRVGASAEDSWSHEYRFRAADGSYAYVFSRGYLVRDEEGRAVRSIGALQDITLSKRVEEDLRWAAYHDPLTSLPNRRMFTEQLGDLLARKEQDASCVGVIVVDVDGFKAINDSLGHAAGDMILKTVGAQIQANLPAVATVARLGGDEFSIILPGLTADDRCAETVTRILHGVGHALAIDESVVDVAVSAGAAMWPMDGTTAEEVLKSAELALYAAKADGSGTVRGFRPAMRDARESRNRMLRDAREALRDDRVIPFYQPKVSLVSGEIVGFEALLRWHHHRRGLQPPHTILAAFEDIAISTKLTDRMIDKVLADMIAWQEGGHAFGRIAINGSPADFRRDDFAERILTKLHDARLSPSLLELEVTESVFLDQSAATVDRALRTLTAEGVTVALDDFGTGYASLTHLRQFPVSALKIDRSFVSRLDGADKADLVIVHGVIDIAHKMNIETVGEGVENEAQLGLLRELGCDIAQGYLFSRPISASRATLLMDRWTRAPGLDGPASHDRDSA
jgi:diguanylate cyclase (GGDEF)-like protein/PAS domain S-box-containing protein